MPLSSERLKQYLRERYAAQRRLFLGILGGRCKRCRTLKDLQIDHKDPKNKSFEIGRLWPEKKLPQAIEELKKCQILCGRCHRKKSGIESSQRQTEKYKKLNPPDGFKHGSLYGWMKKKCSCNLCNKARRKWHDKRNASRRKGLGYSPRIVG